MTGIVRSSSAGAADWFTADGLSPADLSSVFDTSLDAIIVIDAESRVVGWNRSAEETFGWSRSEVIGRELASLVIPERLRSAHAAGMEHYLATGEGPVLHKRIEVPALHRAGHEFPVELAIVPIGSAEGLRFCAFLRDITRRQRNAQKLAQRTLEAEVLYQVVSLLSQGGSVEDSLLICQRKICEISGWSAGHSYRPDNADRPEALVPTGIWHFAEPALEPLRKISDYYTFRPGEGLPGTIWQTGEPSWIIDVGSDPSFLRRELFLEHGVSSAFGFPVRAEGRLAAVLEFFSVSEREPEPELILTVRSISEQLGRVLERQTAIEHQQVLTRELTHRIGNTLAIIGAIFRRLAASAQSKEALSQRFEDRLMALAAGHKMLSENSWNTTPLERLVTETLGPYCERDGESCRIEGPPVELSARLTMTLNMVLHELATNAAKYGALSVPEGRVTIRWTLDRSEGDCAGPMLTLRWIEENGPPVREGSTSGFGSELIRLMMAQNKGGHSAIDLAPTGLTAIFKLPLPPHVAARAAPEPVEAPADRQEAGA